jgi:hypothetical protein
MGYGKLPAKATTRKKWNTIKEKLTSDPIGNWRLSGNSQILKILFSLSIKTGVGTI